MTILRPGVTGFVVFGTGEEILRRCLESMKPAVDEIIGVDTGAKDGARAVAEEFGAKIYDLEWPNSFQDAYNFAIERVQTEWTLWLDSDEWLEADAPDKIRRLTSNKQAAAYSLPRRDFYEHDKYTEMYQLRLWRTHPKMRLQGHIHARFPRLALMTASAGRKVIVCDLHLLHDGFMGGASQEKLRRNLAYIEREMEERPGQPYYEICYAETLDSLGDPQGVKLLNELLDRVIDSTADKPEEPLISIAFVTALQRVTEEEMNSERIDKLIWLGWRWFPKNVPLVWAIAETELKRDNPFAAYYAFLEVEDLSRTGGDRSYSFNPEVFGLPLYVHLSRAAAAIGKWETAERAAARVLEAWPDNPVALTVMNEVRSLKAATTQPTA